MVGNSAFLSSGNGFLGELLEFPKACQIPFRGPRGNVGFLWKHCSIKGPPQACRGEFRGLRGAVAGNLGLLSSCVSTWGIHLCLLREVRSPLALKGEPRESSHIIAGMNRASSRVEAGTQGSSPCLISILASLRSWNRVVRPRLVCCGNTRDSLSSPWYLERKIKPPAATRDKPRDATVNAR